MSRVVTVEQLRKVFRLEGGDRLVAVAEASFRIDQGEVLGLIGGKRIRQEHRGPVSGGTPGARWWRHHLG